MKKQFLKSAKDKVEKQFSIEGIIKMVRVQKILTKLLLTKAQQELLPFMADNLIAIGKNSKSTYQKFKT